MVTVKCPHIGLNAIIPNLGKKRHTNKWNDYKNLYRWYVCKYIHKKVKEGVQMKKKKNSNNVKGC